jgi:plasmid stabilization system protein ParE
VSLVYQVRILPAALEDARDCYNYITEHFPDQALVWFDGLLDVVDSLSSMPKRCPIAPESAIVGTEIRCLLYRKYYRILYCIEGEIVRIYHIRHTARQYLSKEEFLAELDLDIEEF